MTDEFLVRLFSFFWRDSKKYHLMIGERMFLKAGEMFLPIDFDGQGNGYFVTTDEKVIKALATD